MKRSPDLDYHIEMPELGRTGFNEYSALFEKNDTPREEGILEWRYKDNAAKDTSVISLAMHDDSDETSAVYAMMGVTFLFEGKPVAGTQSLDTLTDISHRRRGLFPFLAEKSYARTAELGSIAVYGFPNKNSCPTFAKHLGWTIYGPVNFLVRPLRTGYFLERLLGPVGLGSVAKRFNLRLPAAKPNVQNLTFRTVAAFSKPHEEIWREAAQSFRIAVDRSAEYLNWRIFGRPDGAKYRVIEAVNEVGEIDGFVIWALEEKHGGRIGYLMECLARAGRVEVHSILLRKAIREMSVARADAILAWSISGQLGTRALRGCGFLTLPTRLRPIQLYWGCRSLQPGVELQESDWYISYLDSDTV